MSQKISNRDGKGNILTYVNLNTIYNGCYMKRMVN